MAKARSIISGSPLGKTPYNSRLAITVDQLSANPVRSFEPYNELPVTPTADYTVPVEHEKRIFVQFAFGPISYAANTTLNGWSSWGRSQIATFQGERYSRTPNGGPWGSPNPNSLSRAYPWEYDPVDPENSSPWHNIVYEHVIEAYKWGARSVHFNMPFGGLADVNALTFQEWKKTYTSTTDKRTCPARWKGFKEAIRALLEGNLRPAGKEPITEPMNVAIYHPPIRGDPNMYSVRSTALWESLATTDYERDTIFYSDYVEPFIADTIEMKGRTPNSGKLYLLFDTLVASATPNTLPAFRNKPNYRTDALEMSDWYMFNKLKNNGICVFAEARACKTLVDGGNSYRNDFAYEPSACGYYWWLFTQNSDGCDFAKPEDIKYAYIFEDSNFPLVVEPWDPYQPRLTTTFNGRTRKISYTDPNPAGGINYNTPHFYVWSMYNISDNYRYYYNKATGTNTFKGVNLDTEACVAVSNTKVLPYMTLESNDGIVDPYNNYWRIDGNLVDYRPLLNESVWNSVIDIQSYGGGNGLWSEQGKTYWNTTVRKNTFAEFISFIDNFSRNYGPNLPDWTGVTYGFDSLALGTIHYV